MKDVRALAALSLAGVVAGNSFNGQLPAGKDTSTLSARDQAFFRELVYGTLRFYHQLDANLAPLLKKPMSAKDADIHCLLLLGLYQVEHLRTPDHAAISASVNAARALKKKWACGLVNGVLRNYLRQGRENRQATDGKEGKNAAALWSHPQWLFDKISTDWPQHWQAILQTNNSYPPMSLRVNLSRQSRDEYLKKLEHQGVAASPCEISNSGIRLDKPCDVQQLPGFGEGLASVQGCGAQLAASLLQLQAGQQVLDACAAPGGKSAHILEREKVSLTAIDNDSERLLRVSDNLHRLKLQASVKEADASEPASWWDGQQFDRILLDAPCSGSGVINRHPDIKLLRQAGDIDYFAGQQLELLQALWPLLAPGGLLLYCTCSVLRQENEGVVRQFLSTTENATEQPIDANWGEACNPGRQLLPINDKNDGFFYARLSKLAAV